MKAISLHQPWASLVAIGAKRIETRHWPTGYRGPLAIHAAKKWSRELRELCDEPIFKAALRTGGPWPPEGLPFGAIVATAELQWCRLIQEVSRHPGTMDRLDIGAREETFGNYEPGRYGWGLANVRRLVTPIPFRGAQGFFEIPDELLANADFEVSTEQLAKALPR